MMRGAICLGSMCFLLAACGGDDGREGAEETGTTQASTVPAAEFARQADKLCVRLGKQEVDARIQQRLHAIETSSASGEDKLRRALPILAEQLMIITEFRRNFERLGTPAAHADDVDAMLRKARSAEDELGSAIDSARSGDFLSANESLIRYAGFSNQSADIARDSELNFAYCGAGA